MVILSGVLLVLSFPPFPFAFLAHVAFVPLLLVIDKTPAKTFEDRFWGFFKAIFVLLWRFLTLQFIWRFKQKPWRYQRQIISHNAQVFRYAYTAFVIWNFGTCYWLMMTAFGATGWTEVITYLMAGLVACILNPFLMTIPVYLYTRVKKTGWHGLASLAFVCFWLTFEWLHFNWDLSWSWITLGHAFTLYPSAIQFIEFTGTLGISAQVLIVNVLIYQAVRAVDSQQSIVHSPQASEGTNSPDRTKRKLHFWVPLGGAVLFALAPFLFNPVILAEDRAVFQPVDSLSVRVIQPNIDPYDKSKTYAYNRQIDIMDSLMGAPGIDTIDLVVMPETAIPKGMYRECLRDERLIQPLWRRVYLENLSLLSGFIEFRLYPGDIDPVPIHSYPLANNRIPGRCSSYPAEEIDKAYIDQCNASFMLRVDTAAQTFQKAKLVPMVERMPFLDVLTFLKDWTPELAGSVGGYGYPDTIQNLVVHTGDKVASLICYESEYGDYVREFVNRGARMLTIITNDGWWGESSGHIQHAHFTTLRAIETRRAVARSANTGISLFGDNRGYLYQETEWWTRVYLDRKVPLYEGETFYVKQGDYIGQIAGILSLLWLLLALLMNTIIGRKKPR
jgi:apolipoprotein N-acyltransferase